GEGAAIVELRRVLNAIIGAAAAFDAIPAGELVDPKQIAGVEDEALRILVRPAAGLRLVWARDDLGDWLDRLRAPGLHANERIAVFDTDRRHRASKFAVAGLDEVCDRRVVVDVERGSVRADRSERREHLSKRVREAASPLRLCGEAVVVAGNAAQHAVLARIRAAGIDRASLQSARGCRIDAVEISLVARQAGEIDLVAELAANDRMIEHIVVIDHRMDGRDMRL